MATDEHDERGATGDDQPAADEATEGAASDGDGRADHEVETDDDRAARGAGS